ncbi:MAG: rhodanese-like domain-containing protein [Zetaproteobacteria bacterium]|nr:MAG: rhodanese-like domain-containing protein [Zetaproteobacteria bacterium]
MKQITVEELHRLWSGADDEQCCLIDVRTPEEYARGHVPGARLISLDALPARAHEVPKDRDVYLICRSGARSAQALKYLSDHHGHARLFNVAGGTLAWIEAGYPVEQGAG